jgi:hypothetical protein
MEEGQEKLAEVAAMAEEHGTDAGALWAVVSG